MFAHLAVLTMGILTTPHAGAAVAVDRPRVQVWTNRRDDPYNSGQAVRVYFQTERDGYVTLLRVDTDGRVRVLFPREPWEDNFARGGRPYEVPGHASREAFDVDDYPGVGYLFAVVADDPFAYDPIESAEHWDYRSIADDGRVRGDPYVALTELAERLLPSDYNNWDYDITPYYVQQHYQYPRFLCYDCHSYVSYSRWNPYDYSCVRFRIVMFDDPYYYPYRYYGGTRVVFTRPYRPEPRFIFKDRVATDPFITRVRERPTNDNGRRYVGVRGRDLGGSGVIPTPDIDRRRGRPNQLDDAGARRPAQPDQPARPSHPDGPNRPSGRERPDHPTRPDHPDQRDHPDQSDHPDRPVRPDNANRRGDLPQRDVRPPGRVAPQERPEPARTEPARAEPVRPEPRRAEPRSESPARSQPEARSQPAGRSQPQAESRREGSRDPTKHDEPELRRRKP